MLAVSGQLDPKPPVGSVVARTGEGPTGRPRLGRQNIVAAINDPRDTHRSVYRSAEKCESFARVAVSKQLPGMLQSV